MRSAENTSSVSWQIPPPPRRLKPPPSLKLEQQKSKLRGSRRRINSRGGRGRGEKGGRGAVAPPSLSTPKASSQVPAASFLSPSSRTGSTSAGGGRGALSPTSTRFSTQLRAWTKIHEMAGQEMLALCEVSAICVLKLIIGEAFIMINHVPHSFMPGGYRASL